MNRFVKAFVSDSVSDLCDKANQLAEQEKLLIVSAHISFSGSGRTYEMPVLTVVFERGEAKGRKPSKKDGGGVT